MPVWLDRGMGMPGDTYSPEDEKNTQNNLTPAAEPAAARDSLVEEFPGYAKGINAARARGIKDSDIYGAMRMSYLHDSATMAKDDLFAKYGQTPENQTQAARGWREGRLEELSALLGMDKERVAWGLTEAETFGLPAQWYLDENVRKTLPKEYRLEKVDSVAEALGARQEAQDLMGDLADLRWRALFPSSGNELTPDEANAMFAPGEGAPDMSPAAPLTRETAPELFAEIDKKAKRLAEVSNLRPAGAAAKTAASTLDLFEQAFTQGIRQNPKLFFGTLIGGAGLGAMAGGLPGAVAGAARAYPLAQKLATGMYFVKMSVTDMYESLISLEKDGKPALTPEQARNGALLFGSLIAAIEDVSLGRMAGAMVPQAARNLAPVSKALSIPEGMKAVLRKALSGDRGRLLTSAPSFKKALLETLGNYAANVGAESIEEGEQKFVEVVGGAITTWLAGNPVYTVSEAVEKAVREGARETLESAETFAYGMAIPNIIGLGTRSLAARSYNRSAEGRRQEAAHKLIDAKMAAQGEAQFSGKAPENLIDRDFVSLPQSALETLYQSSPEAKTAAEKLGLTGREAVEGTGEIVMTSDEFERLKKAVPEVENAAGEHIRRGLFGRTTAEVHRAVTRQDRANDPFENDADPDAKAARSLRFSFAKELRAAGRNADLAAMDADLWSRYVYNRVRQAKAEGKETSVDAMAERLKVRYQEEAGGRNDRGDTFHSEAYETALKIDGAKWQNTVDRIFSGAYDLSKAVPIMRTPLVFTLVKTRDGQSVAPLPLYVSAGKVKKIRKKHAYMTQDVLKQLPQALSDPIAIFRSAEKSANPNGLVALLELSAVINEQGDKDNVVAALALNQRKDGTGIDVNILSSAYTKSSEQSDGTRVPNPNWFVGQEKLGNLLYINEQKSSAWSAQAGVQFPSPADTRNLSENIVKTEADLVKLRKENGNRFYQERVPDGARIVETAKSNGTYLKAPNGNETNLTPEQWVLVRTERFKEWFGDWENDPENASKVLDGNGEPLVVYHGSTHTGFSTFSTTGVGDTTGAGAFFSGRKDVAATYSGSDELVSREPGTSEPGLSGEGIYPVFLNLRNPYHIDAEGKDWANVGEISVYDNETGESIYDHDGEPFRTPREAEEYIERDLDDYSGRYEVSYSVDEMTTNEIAQNIGEGNYGDGFDGVIFENVVDEGHWGSVDAPGDVYVAYAPNQIKAVDNRGTFDDTGNIYTQAVRTGINLDERVRVINLSAAIPQVKGWNVTKLAKYVKSLIGNEPSISLDALGIVGIPSKKKKYSHIAASDHKVPGELIPTRNAAVFSIEELLKNSMLVEVEDNVKKGKKPDIESYLKFYVPVSANGKLYTVEIITESQEKIDPANVILADATAYDVKLTQKKNPSPTLHRNGVSDTRGSFDVTVRQMLENVKGGRLVNEIEALNGTHLSQERRGQIQFGPGGASIITLFKDADASTFVHEMGHLMLRDLLADALEEDAGERERADLAAVKEYLGLSDEDAAALAKGSADDRLRQKHEQFARAFEAYLLTGQAPSKGLKRVFAWFRRELLRIYADVRALDVELSPEITALFDRLLSVETAEDETLNMTVNDLALEENLLKQRLKELEGQEDLLPDPGDKYDEGYERGVKAGRKQGVKEGREKLRAQLKAARQKRDEIRKLVKSIKTMAKSRSVIWDKRRELLKLLEDYTLRRPTDATLQRGADVRAYLDTHPEVDEADLSQRDRELLRTFESTTLRDLTVGDLRELEAKVADVYTQGHEEYARWKEARRQRRLGELDDLLGAVESRAPVGEKDGTVASSRDLDRQYDGAAGKARRAKDALYAWSLGSQRLTDWIGNGKGKFKSAVTRFFADAVNAARDGMLRQTTRRQEYIEQVMGELKLSYLDLGRKRAVAQDHLKDGRVVAEKLSLDALLAIYALMKNKKGRAAVLFGNMAQWADPEGHAQKCLALLSGKEKLLADAVIGEYAANFDRLNDVFIRVYNQGMTPEENYVPMSRLEYTSSLGWADDKDAAQELAFATAQAGARASLEKGFLIDRMEISEENQKPVELGLISTWLTHMKAQEHTAAYAELAGDLSSVMGGLRRESDGQTFKKAVSARLGKGAFKALNGYVNIVLQDEFRIANNMIDKCFAYFAGNMAATYLAGSVSVLLKQLTSIPRFVAYADCSELLRAFADFVSKDIRKEVYDLNPQMRERLPSATMTLFSGIDETKLSRVQWHYKHALDVMMKPIAAFDRSVALIGWLAAYRTQIKRGASQEAAVREAQRAVALTQQVPHIKDMPMAWQTNKFVRYLMMFTTDAAPQFGMSAYDFFQGLRDGGDRGTSVRTLLALTMTAILMKSLTDGGPDDPDDPDRWFKWVLSALGEQTLENVPLFGKELASTVDQSRGGYGGQGVYMPWLFKIIHGFSQMHGERADKVGPDGLTGFARGMLNAVEGFSLVAVPMPVTAAKRFYRMAKADDAAEALKILIGQRRRQKKKERRWL